ncbi:MAG: glycosyltransferase family 4 protein [Thermomicrobiales bacterium]
MTRSPVIGIDGSRLTICERTGTETYSFQLLRAVAEIKTKEQLRVYLNATTAPQVGLDSFDYVEMPFPRLWTHVRLSWEMARRPPGVLFVPSHVVPLWHPPSVVTVHDLGYLCEPEAHPPNQRRMLDWTTRWSCRTATKIIAISHTTKRDLIAHYHVPESKIRVIHHGISRTFSRASPAEVYRVRNAYDLPDRFVLFVGTVQPRKNIARIAEAVSRLASAGLPHKLVVAGKFGWLGEHFERDLETFDRPELVHRLGYIPEGDLTALYSGADAFCFPSLYEGFGLPVLEAMACEVPVVTSNRGSLPEIAGEAALLVDPTSVDQIASALIRVLTDNTERFRLIDGGKQRVRDFSWSKTAVETLRLLIEVRDQSQRAK